MASGKSPAGHLYRLTIFIGLCGVCAFFLTGGVRAAAGFALGALASLGNLWLWDWLTRAIHIPVQEPGKRPWQAGLFIGRYVILWGAGYAIVKVLGVQPLAVVVGLLTSTAAVLVSLIIEIIKGFLGNQPT